jgi:hypothetical protein
MIIETKYNIGDTFWVPRVRKEYRTETLNFEGEEWSREICELVPFAKQKVVDSIRVYCYDELIECKYIVKNVGDSPTTELSGLIKESDIKGRTEQKALEFANKWAKNKKKEYFGS